MKAKCITARSGYEHVLEAGKEHEVTDIQHSIFPGSYYVLGIGEGGKKFTCHLYRFDIPEEVAKVHAIASRKRWNAAQLDAQAQEES
jgi:hypothetical protein